MKEKNILFTDVTWNPHPPTPPPAGEGEQNPYYFLVPLSCGRGAAIGEGFTNFHVTPVIQNHPNTLPDYLEQLSETLANPDRIRPSKHDPQALLFSKWFDTIRTGRYLIVITVSYLETNRHWIITAYTARKLAGDIS